MMKGGFSMTQKRTIEEKIAELQKKQAQLKAQEKALKAKQSAEKRKKDTHRKIVIWGAVESVLGFPLDEDDIPRLISFLKDQEKRGYFFSSALGYSHETDNTGKVIYKKKNP